MSAYVLTICDECNPTGRTSDSLHMRYVDMIPSEAIRCGWQRYRDGSGIERHRCPECQEKG